ncbi:TspO/MBR family protein [Methanobacterium formicicum]|jgi:tryptophan-rich sensory protein|uniref:Tryptophan-rich sensory protein n=1 Tax=Methanobacterium formicicum TaxID=2162 RepID=A0A843AQ20_METFO|nr:TspO/MBR family protein [Methanobacterium formicicum]MBF4475918.1 tryptophan-rich sensory protein [Methanobacterium formicicum]
MEGFKLNEIPRLVIALIIVFIVGGIGSAATYSQIPLWYVNVIKPTWAPPNWLFGVVWTILYILIGTSLFMVWRKGLETKPAKIALAVFAVQLGLNLLWSLVFFGLHSILGGLVIIILMWLAILVNIILFYRISKWAGLILLPYIVWVTIATYLNYSIYLLN